MYVFLLSGENVELAKEEVLSLSKSEDYSLDDRLLLIENKFDFSRLAFSHKVYIVIAITKDIEKEIEQINWQKYYKKDFCVRIVRLPSSTKVYYDEKFLGSLIWRKLNNPKVNLDNPTTKFEFIFTKNNIYVCLFVEEINKKSLKSRDSIFRPGFHPASMNASFARALLNLANAKRNNLVLDPFCGVGGILIEAGLLGCRIVGYDIDSYIIKKCKENLDFYKIKNFSLKVKDALNITGKFDIIVTDFPYGRHSSLHGRKIIELYNKFIEVSYKILKKNGKIVIVLPSDKSIDIRKFILKTTILHRIHKTLTRKILVLEKS